MRAGEGPRFAGALLPSLDRTAAEFDPQRYWRGPSWANTTWLVIRGLRRHGALRSADELRAGLLRAVATEGFREYFDADTGAGTTNFSWTAALVLDLLRPVGGRVTAPPLT